MYGDQSREFLCGYWGFKGLSAGNLFLLTFKSIHKVVHSCSSIIHQDISSHMGASDILSKLCRGGTTDFLWKVYENNA